MAGISLKGIKKAYGKTAVIHGIDWEIKDGDFVVIVGPSGCGKSTLLRMIAGLESITEGEVSIGGTVVNKLEPSQRNIAMVFQNYALYPHMTVYKNMAYGLKLQKLPADEIESRVQKAAKILEIEDYLDRLPRELSGGQRQRVAMGRAIVREPAVFLFDEPLSNLDAKLRVQMRLEIKNLQHELGITSVYVTHDQVEAMTLGDQLAVLNGGYVEQLGSPIEIYERPASTFVAGFIGSPAMNLLAGEIIETGAQTMVRLEGGGVARSMVPTLTADLGMKVNIGVRPEDLVETDGEPLFSGEVEITEALGEVTLLYFKPQDGGAAVVGKLPGIHADLRRKTVKLSADPKKVQIFAQGQSLLYR